MIGFPQKTGEIRISQYESGSRVPKDDLTGIFASALNVSPRVLTVPDIDDEIGILCTLFALEDHYGLRVTGSEDRVGFTFDNHDSRTCALNNMLREWLVYANKLKSGEIDKSAYDHWRYNYPTKTDCETNGTEVLENEKN